MNEPCPLQLAVRRGLAAWPADSIGVVAVSGGPDSVALLRALVLEAKGSLVTAHLNHQLRGAESDADEAFVHGLHAQLAIGTDRLLPLRCQRIDVRTAAGSDNLASTARRLRYDWLLQVARETAASWVATGHTADDQAETVLHRLLRGAGLRGLAGIPRQRELAPGITVIRPLLDVTRQHVLAFLEQLGQIYRQDSSNADPHYLRNRLRHELLPLLIDKYTPAAKSVLCRLAEQAGEAQAFVAMHAARLLRDAELPRAGAMVVLDTRRLTGESHLVIREALRSLWEREGWSLAEMGFADWRRVADVATGQSPAVDLPGGIRVHRAGHVMQITIVQRPQSW